MQIASFLLLIGVALLGAFREPEAYLRFFEALRDFALTIGSMFAPVRPTVTTFSYSTAQNFPRLGEDIARGAVRFWDHFISADNFFGYLYTLAESTRWVVVTLLLLLLLLVIVFAVGYSRLTKENRCYGGRTKPLVLFQCIEKVTFRALKSALLGWIAYIKQQKGYRYALLAICLFYLNVYTILIEFVAFYLYFVLSLDAAALIGQILKLCWDAALALKFLPWWLWIPVGLYCFDTVRRRAGYRKLDAEEDKLRDFIDELAIVFMICAPMREGKTTLLTSILMSQEKMFRQKADSAIFEIRMRFPDFPWQRLQFFLRQGMKRHIIYTLVTCRDIVAQLKTIYEAPKEVQRTYLRYLRNKFRINSNLMPDLLFGYDTRRFRTAYRDELGGETLWHAIEDFAQLYFIYASPTSLIDANYNIRLENDRTDHGNYPDWEDDFFRIRNNPAHSLNAHVLNQDALRLGIQKDPANPFNNALEFGVIGQQEIGKERGNQYETQGLSVRDKYCNQKTDRYNSNLKLIGHKATVRFIPFISFGCDEQRPEDWGAEARNLCDIITIRNHSKEKIFLPFFAFEELLYRTFTPLVKKLYKKLSVYRGDMTLTVYLIVKAYGLLYDHYIRVRNTFGGYYDILQKESGMKIQSESVPSKSSSHRLFVSYKKVYSGRFATASWQPFYTERTRKSKYGLNDINTYKGLTVSKEEMQEAHSHFFEKLSMIFEGIQEDPPRDSGGRKETNGRGGDQEN